MRGNLFCRLGKAYFLGKCEFSSILQLKLTMKKITILFVISVLLCTVPLSGVLAKKKSDPESLGWGLAIGALYFPQPKFTYESTSIGDIDLSCDTYGTTLSFFLLRKGTLFRWKPSYQVEFGLGWVRERGNKSMTAQGYPAIAESDFQQIGVGIGLIVDYLKIGKVRIGSGFEGYGGWTRERFSICLLRDGQKIGVFDPKGETFSGSGGFILLSARIIDNAWNSWDIRFGYGGIDMIRNNDYDRHSLEDFSANTSVRGWYFHIRKLIPFELRKEPLPEGE